MALTFPIRAKTSGSGIFEESADLRASSSAM